MQSISQLFERMNNTDFPYVVLRNFENLPESVATGGHGDLDLLVYDRHHFKELFPESVMMFPEPRVMHKIRIDDLNIYVDVRYVGDGYYPTHFEQSILETREFNEKGFFTPDPIHFRLGLVFHAVHHKNYNNYKRWIGDASIKDMLEALKSSKICYSIPSDLTVGTFNQYWKGATSVVSREGGKIIKEQNSYTDFNLGDNEERILNIVNSKHFPKVYGKEDNRIIIEDCGERLNIDNIPDNWYSQLKQILRDLKMFHVEHRDITPNNLMVKDGIIKLIDFGWSKLKDENDNPPACLGYPYKPTWGFDDNFSMRKIIKELEYKLEEVEV